MRINRALCIVLAALLICTVLPVVSFASGTVTVSGEANFVSAPEGTYSKLAYTATYDNGTDAAITDPAAFTWEVTEDGTPATDVFCINGELIVAGGAEGTYVLTATHTASGTKSADFPITVTKSTSMYTDGEILAATNTKLSLTLSDSQNITSGVKTVTFKFRIPSTATGNSEKFLTEEKGWKESIKVSASSTTFRLYRNYSGTNYIKNQDGEDVTFNYDTWYEFAYVYDMTNSKYSVYIDGKPCKISSASEVPFVSGMSSHNYYVYNDICDAVAFSGVEYTPSVEIESDNTILIPQASGKKTHCEFSASSLFYGSDNITWSIPEITGVSIDENTGVITVTDEASAGNVTVTATQNGLTGTATLNLIAINEDFSSYTEGSTLTSPFVGSPKPALDGTNMYASRVHNEYIGYYFPKVGGSYTSGTGNVVVEFKYKSSTSGTGILLKKSSGWNKKIILGTTSTWKDVKVIYNPDANTMTMFVDGYLQASVYNTPDNLSDRELERVLMYAEAVDDIKIYNVSSSTPGICGAAFSSTVPGTEMKLTYQYVDEGGMPDNGTTIAWSYADTKDSATWQPLSQYDNMCTIDAEKTAELSEKYIKAVITPKHAERYGTGVVTGESFEIITQITNIQKAYSYSKDGAAFDVASDVLSDGETLSLTFSAYQVAENATNTYMVVMAQFTADGKELVLADAKELTTVFGSEQSVTVSQTKDSNNIIKVFVWEKAGLVPVQWHTVK